MGELETIYQELFASGIANNLEYSGYEAYAKLENGSLKKINTKTTLSDFQKGIVLVYTATEQRNENKESLAVDIAVESINENSLTQINITPKTFNSLNTALHKIEDMETSIPMAIDFKNESPEDIQSKIDSSLSSIEMDFQLYHAIGQNMNSPEKGSAAGEKMSKDHDGRKFVAQFIIICGIVGGAGVIMYSYLQNRKTNWGEMAIGALIIFSFSAVALYFYHHPKEWDEVTK